MFKRYIEKRGGVEEVRGVSERSVTVLSAGRLALVWTATPAPPLTTLLGPRRAGAVSGEGTGWMGWGMFVGIEF